MDAMASWLDANEPGRCDCGETETTMMTYTLFPSFPQLQANRAAVKRALESAGIRWRNGWGTDETYVDCRDEADAETLRAALRANRTRDGVWPYGVREKELFG